MQKTNLTIGVLLLPCIFSMTGCGSGTQEKEKTGRIAEHVFLIRLDGWGSYSIEKADMPHYW